MATELGQAYVQIMPSAKGIKGSIQGVLDPEAESASKSAGSKIGPGLKVAAAAGVAAAAAGLGKIISSSLTEGANLQQSLGGIETLFKGSAGKMKEYANDAYKTVGLSANDYMETVTSFSASLLQGLGGDTEKAADKANMAMIDMGDNANKMGTDMESIQVAYQGFAKQNYTMLDNLKLGYGGTKSEMERLLADATKLSGVEYNIENLSDVYDAIHVIQEDIGITGTTAKEAEETFSGSMAAMKASASNFLGNLALGQDIGPSLTALADTVSTFLFNNLIPMVGNIVKGLPGAIKTFFSAAIPELKTQFKNMFDGAFGGAFSSVDSGISKITSNFKTGFGNLGTTVKDTLGTIFDQLPGLFDSVVNSVTPAIESISGAFAKLDFSGIQEFASAIIPAVQNGFSTMMAIIQPAIDKVVTSFKDLWNALQPVLSTLADALMPVFQAIGSFLGGAFNVILTAVSVAFDGIRKVIEFLSPVITALVGVFNNLGNSGSSLKSTLSSAWNGIKSVISTVGSGISAVINTIKSIFSGLGTAGNSLKSIMSSAWNGIKSVISIVANGISSIISGIKSVFSGLSSSGSTLSSGISSAWNTMKSGVSNAASGIRSLVSGVSSAFSGLRNISIADAGRAIMNGFLGGLKAAWEGVKSFVSGIGTWIKNHKGPLSYDKKLLIPAGNAIMLGLDSGLQDQFKSVKSTVSGMADNLSDSFGIPGLALDTTMANGLRSSVVATAADAQTANKKPLVLTLILGGQAYKAFVDDITNEQERAVNLALSY